MQTLQQHLATTRDFLAQHWPTGQPDLILVLGSGLSTLTDLWPLSNRLAIPYAEIPHFPVSTVAGHAGQLTIGQWSPSPDSQPLNLAILQGRFHYYEGYSMAEVVYPLRALRHWGATRLLVTNAAGGLDPAFQPGDWMLIRDQINLTGDHPLRGPNPEFLGPRFFDMSDPYETSWSEAIANTAREQGLTLRQGVYVGLSGPSYETPAEVRMVRQLGASAVGMSTVAEVLAARHMGLKVAGLSCITNPAAGIAPAAGLLNHEEVMATGSNPAVLAHGETLLLGALDYASQHRL